MFILTNSLNFFAGTSKTSFNLDFKTGGKFVCFDLLVVGASSSLLYAKLITTNCQKSFSKFKLVLHVPAKKFKEIVKINIDPHKILDNFCLMKNYLEECLSHHNISGLFGKLYMKPTFLLFLLT